MYTPEQQIEARDALSTKLDSWDTGSKYVCVSEFFIHADYSPKMIRVYRTPYPSRTSGVEWAVLTCFMVGWVPHVTIDVEGGTEAAMWQMLRMRIF